MAMYTIVMQRSAVVAAIQLSKRFLHLGHFIIGYIVRNLRVTFHHSVLSPNYQTTCPGPQEQVAGSGGSGGGGGGGGPEIE